MYQKDSNGWLKHLDFIILDIVCMQATLLIAYMFRNGFSFPLFEDVYQQMAIIITIMDIVVVFFMQSYDGILRRGYFKEFKETLYHVSLTIIGFILFNFLTRSGQQYSRIVVVLMWELSIIFCYLVRILRKKVLFCRAKDAGKGKKAMVILVGSALAEKFVKRISNYNYENRKIAGVILLDENQKGTMIENIPVVASGKDASAYLCQNWVDEVITCYNNNEDVVNPILQDCREMGITIHVALLETGKDSGKKQVENIAGYTVVTSYLASASNRQMFCKRFMDIFGGLIGCLITAVLFVFLAPAIYIASPGPVFFSQIRVGKNGRKFRIYKFRSMYMDAEERKKELMKQNKVKGGMMFKMDHDPRIIKGIGHFIRKTSLDEFPQFFNVLKGDMSLVGTRPPTVDEWEKYNKYHRRRMAIKPGLTGMWQVSGRSSITDFDEVVALDTKYISQWNLGLDIKILLKTIGVIVTGRGSQ